MDHADDQTILDLTEELKDFAPQEPTEPETPTEPAPEEPAPAEEPAQPEEEEPQPTCDRGRTCTRASAGRTSTRTRRTEVDSWQI